MKKLLLFAAIVCIAIFSCKKKEDKPEPKVPVITITTQPAATTTVTFDDITGSLTVAATATQGATLSYQWYSNATAVNTGGTAVSGATSASFTIPATLAVNTYYYFCEVRAAGGAAAVRSNVATVTVIPAVTTITTQPAALQPLPKEA